MHQSLALFSSEVRERFRAFIEQEINPGADDRDAHDLPLPRALMRRCVELKLLQMPLPRELGGEEMDVLRWGLVLEQIGYLSDDASLPVLMSMRSAIPKAIWESGRKDLIEKYAAPMARSELAGALAYSDGGDAFSFSSNVKRVDGGLIITGAKCLVTGGSDADVFMTYVRDVNGDMIVVLIERTDPGVTIEPVPVTGLRSLGLCSLRFHETVLPDDRVLVACDGLSHAQRFLNARRVLLGCAPLGRMDALVELCVATLRDTIRYRMPVIEMQNVQATIGRMYIKIEACRSLLYRALSHASEAGSGYEAVFDPLVSAAKYFAAETAAEIAHSTFRLLGGKGYTRALRVERFLRDAYGLMAGGGAQDVLEVELGVSVAARYEHQHLRGKA